jgi:hypothetical protein
VRRLLLLPRERNADRVGRVDHVSAASSAIERSTPFTLPLKALCPGG